MNRPSPLSRKNVSTPPVRDSPLRRRNEAKVVETPKATPQYPEWMTKMVGDSPGGFYFYFAISAALTILFMGMGGFLLEFAFHFITIIIIAISIWAYRSI